MSHSTALRTRAGKEAPEYRYPLIKLGMALGYSPDVRSLFGTSKFDTMEELDMIRRKSGDKRAYGKKVRRNEKGRKA